jgi:hypothetical protein
LAITLGNISKDNLHNNMSRIQIKT